MQPVPSLTMLHRIISFLSCLCLRVLSVLKQRLQREPITSTQNLVPQMVHLTSFLHAQLVSPVASMQIWRLQLVHPADLLHAQFMSPRGACCVVELGEEGLLLDALAIVAQPLAAVIAVTTQEQCSAGLDQSQLTVHCQRPPYQLQLRVQQARMCMTLDLLFAA